MPFFYRRKPKPPTSTIFVPLIKLFKTTYRKQPPSDDEKPIIILETDTGSPILLSGPKSRYGLGISLHFIILPEDKSINTEVLWKFARREMREALIIEGLTKGEADMYALRLIDPITPPPEVVIEYAEEDFPILEDLRRVVTYQLLQGSKYDGTHEAMVQIYSDLAEIFQNLSAKRAPSSPEAAEALDGIMIRNIEVTIRQEDIEKKSIMDIEGKFQEIAKFFDMFSQKKYTKRMMPQDLQYIQRLYR